MASSKHPKPSPSSDPSRSTPTANEWTDIESVFNDVVELSGDERRQRLLKLTDGNNALRGEVESLLAHDVASSKLPTVRQSKEFIAAPDRKPGSSLEGYRLLFPVAINRGSEVWCAEDTKEPDTNRQRVAIKFLRDSASSASRFERFRNEAILLARFRHPDVAEFLDCGRDADEIPFIVMRYVSGAPITEFADKKTLTIDERIQLMIRVCDAVSYAHRFLVVHRDLKPSNILVTSEHQPVILDFGISKTLQDPANNNNPQAALSLTTTGERPMTPAYASPEQVHGDAVTTATDSYGLGLILYELLTGHHPYSGEAHQQETKLLDRICRSSPRAPSDIVSATASNFPSEDGVPRAPRMLAAQRNCSERQLRQQLRGSLDSVISRAIAKNTECRYGTVAELRNDLQNVLQRRPVAVKLRQDRVRNFIRRHPLASIAAATVLSLSVLAAIGSLSVARWKSETNSQHSKTAIRLHDAQSEHDKIQAALNTATAKFAATESALLAVASGQPLSNITNLQEHASDDARSFLASRLAGKGEYERAASILNNATTWDSDTASWQSAEAYQLLGAPGKGLDCLATTLPTTSLQRATTRLRLLLDADRLPEADRYVKSSDLDFTDSPIASLTLAEYRYRIGWEPGAIQLIESLREMRSGLALSADHVKQLAWLSKNTKPLEELISRRPVPLTLRGRVLLRQAKDLEKANQADDAIAKYREVIDHFATDCPDHIVSFVATQQLSELTAEIGQKDESTKWRKHLWNRISTTQEWGTSTAVWCAINLLQTANRTKRREILARLDERPNVLLDPYLRRQVLTYKFELGILDEDWPLAHENVAKLEELEQELWGISSIEYAYAFAARAYVLDNLPNSDNNEVAELRKQLYKIIKDLKKTLPKSHALVFLMPIGRTEEVSTPAHEWIHLYLMHRFNEDNVQRQMIRHVIRELGPEQRETAKLLRRGLD